MDDDLWASIEPLLPAWPDKAPGPRPMPDRLCLQGILYVLRNDIAWQLLPPELGFGSGRTCWRRLERWQRARVFDRLHRILLGDTGYDLLHQFKRLAVRWERRTLHPRPAPGTTSASSTAGDPSQDRPHRLTPHSLQDPELTGMTRHQLNELVDALTPALEVQREQALHTRRVTNASWPPAAGAKAKLTPPTGSWPPSSTCGNSPPWNYWASSSASPA